MVDLGGGDRVARHREVWEAVNERFTDLDADLRWQASEVVWGLFAVPERDIGALGEVGGLDVLELGCGTAYLSAWLCRAGARVTALDVSHDQLVTAQRCQGRHGPTFALVEATGDELPLVGDSFDLVVGEYGVAPWCDPGRWVPEVARVLRPGGRLVFLTSSPLAAMCVPAEGGVAGDRLLRGVDDIRAVAWPGGGVEYHPTHGEWVQLLHAHGFAIEVLHELRPPAGAEDHPFYEIVTADWARTWPAEDLWCARH